MALTNAERQQLEQDINDFLDTVDGTYDLDAVQILVAYETPSGKSKLMGNGRGSIFTRVGMLQQLFNKIKTNILG